MTEANAASSGDVEPRGRTATAVQTKTYAAKPGEIGRRWFVIDADGQVLGRLASRAAHVIRGKHKPPFTPHTDVGDFVVVVNAEKVKLTGNKLDRKKFRRHTGYPGGLVEIPYRRLLQTHPERAIEQAVWGMLPKGRLGRQLRHKLKVYRGAEHPHSSQKPEPLDVHGPIPVHVDPPPAPKPRKPKERKAKEPKAGPAGATTKTTRKRGARGSAAKATPKGTAKKGDAPKASTRKRRQSTKSDSSNDKES